MNDEWFKIAGIIGTVIGIIFISIVIYPLMGAFLGAVFGFLFNETATLFLSNINMGNMEFWQFGAVVAFIGGFFKSTHAFHDRKNT